MAINTNKIWIVGCGPGGPELITREADRAVAQSKIVFGSQRLLQLFPESTAKLVTLPSRVGPALRTITEHEHGDPIAVLVSGDPGVFSLATPIVQHFGPDRCVIVPGISSLQVAFARLGMNWSDARIISSHGRIPKVSTGELFFEDRIAIFVGTHEAAAWVFRVALELSDTHSLIACENLSLPMEAVREIDPNKVDPTEIASLALLILVRSDMLEKFKGQEINTSMGETE